MSADNMDVEDLPGIDPRKKEEGQTGPSAEIINVCEGKKKLQPKQLGKDDNQLKGDDLVTSATDLLKMHFKPLEWIVPDVIVEGLTILAGHPKAGKSLLCYRIAVAVAAGQEFLDRPISKQKILYFALEDGKRRAQYRVRQIMRSNAQPDYLGITTLEKFPFDQALRIVEEKIKKFQPRMVILDTLMKMGLKIGGSYAEAYSAITGLNRIANLYHIALIVVHHSTKSKQKDFVLSLIGSQALAGAADAIGVLVKPRNKNQGTFSITGRDIEDMSFPLELTEGVWELTKEPEPEEEMSERRKAVLELLRAFAMTLAGIAKALGISPENARTVLHRMAKAGQVAKTPDGKYTPLI